MGLSMVVSFLGVERREVERKMREKQMASTF